MDPGHPFHDPWNQDRRVEPGEKDYWNEMYPALAKYDTIRPLTWSSQPPDDKEDE